MAPSSTIYEGTAHGALQKSFSWDLAKQHLKNHMGEGTFQKRPFSVRQRMIIIRINAAGH